MAQFCYLLYKSTAMTNKERDDLQNNPEQADIDRARKEDGNKADKPNNNERPGEIADTVPQLSEDELKPDTGEDDAGPEQADIEQAKRQNR